MLALLSYQICRCVILSLGFSQLYDQGSFALLICIMYASRFGDFCLWMLQGRERLNGKPLYVLVESH